MNELDDELILTLRSQLAEGQGIVFLVDEVLRHHGQAKNEAMYPIRYFCKAFGLRISQAILITQGRQFMGGTLSDAELDALLLPVFRESLQRFTQSSSSLE